MMTHLDVHDAYVVFAKREKCMVNLSLATP